MLYQKRLLLHPKQLYEHFNSLSLHKFGDFLILKILLLLSRIKIPELFSNIGLIILNCVKHLSGFIPKNYQTRNNATNFKAVLHRIKFVYSNVNSLRKKNTIF